MLEGQMEVDYLLTPELPILQANSTLPDHCYNDAQTKSQTCGCQGEGEQGKEDWEFGVSRCKLLYIYIGWINNKILLYSTGNHSLASGTIMEKNVKKNIYHLYIHICMY